MLRIIIKMNKQGKTEVKRTQREEEKEIQKIYAAKLASAEVKKQDTSQTVRAATTLKKVEPTPLT